MSNVHTTSPNPPVTAPTKPDSPAPPSVPDCSPELAEDVERLRREEQAKIERRRQEELARLRELARYD